MTTLCLFAQGRLALVITGICLFAGCSQGQDLNVDISREPIRFVINHKGWPAPMWYPTVTEFALAGDDDKLVWQIESSDTIGRRAFEFEIVYGRVPQGFQQVYPVAGAAPRQLVPERTYYVAAGGPEGQHGALYRLVFALPRGKAEDALLPGAPQPWRGMPLPDSKPTNQARDRTPTRRPDPQARPGP